MPPSRRCLEAICIVLLYSLSASADYVISIGTPGAENVDLEQSRANQSIDFFLGEDLGGSAAQPVSSVVAFFSLEQGLIEGIIVPAGTETATNATGTVSATGAGTVGYFGAGNLAASTISKESDTSFLINQEFTNAMQPVNDSLAPLRWFTVNVDTTGLAPGTYGVTLSSPNASFRNSMNRPVAARANLSFTVTAIPEPSSVVAIAILGGGSLLVRRFRRRKSQKTSV
ncbi:hypothetical protein Poly51_30130 [Rubripirellula tenax]|uniref:PEP-CTERM protein-sorting domain-containing protein n=1 Tax=Rubripirellula tenax TaxID=2528015 RepID=A0A5C6F846_9BACT|nr:PEP-CTERM sorting domain-containing protein [Rubripirellula tenax]TWU57092.1 hypothetical protein Poly51_30130 [Rubripirellula tenax]